MVKLSILAHYHATPKLNPKHPSSSTSWNQHLRHVWASTWKWTPPAPNLRRVPWCHRPHEGQTFASPSPEAAAERFFEAMSTRGPHMLGYLRSQPAAHSCQRWTSASATPRGETGWFVCIFQICKQVPSTLSSLCFNAPSQSGRLFHVIAPTLRNWSHLKGQNHSDFAFCKSFQETPASAKEKAVQKEHQWQALLHGLKAIQMF